MKDKIKLQVQGLTNSQIQSGAYALILTEESGFHRIPIIVGTAEAQSIAIALEKIIPPRPLSHDLFISFMNAFGIRLCEVFIYKFEDGVFYSQLHLAGESKVIDIDSRTSDAIAIALRTGADIYTTAEIIRECGIIFNEQEEDEDDEPIVEEEEEIFDDILNNEELNPDSFESKNVRDAWLRSLPDNTLQEKFKKAIINENYEYAQIYRDEIDRRKTKEGGSNG